MIQNRHKGIRLKDSGNAGSSFHTDSLSDSLGDIPDNQFKNRSASAPVLKVPSKLFPFTDMKRTSVPTKTPNERRFFNACKIGNNVNVTQLLKSSPILIYSKDCEGKSGLHIACMGGHKNIVSNLLNLHAQIDAKDKYGRTPLHTASISGHLNIVRYLIKKGHDPNARNTDRNACLHYLVRIENFDKLKKTLDILIKSGAIVDVKNKFDETPLQLAAARGSVDVCRYLIKNNAQVDARNKIGATALQQAVIMSQLEVVKLLLDSGADPTLKMEGKYGNSLEVAKSHKKTEILELLQPWVQQWNLLKSECSKNDENWRTKTIEARIRESFYTDVGQVTSQSLEMITKAMREPLASEFDGWFEETPSGKVPLPTEACCRIESEVYFYSKHFYKHKHQNYMGTMKYFNKEREPIIVSIMTERETDNSEYKALIWIVKESWFFLIPKEHIANNNNKFLCKYLSMLIGQRYDIRVDIKLEQIGNSLQSFVTEKLYELEMNDPQVPRILSVGVVYVKNGQTTEKEYLANTHKDTSDAYKKFLVLLGNKIKLLNYKGFKANLDVSENQQTGKTAIHYKKDGYEIMYHTSTLIPKSSEDEYDGQQILRKQFLGNDVVCIVFQEGGSLDSLIRSQFIHVYIVVRPIEIMGKLHFQLSVIRKDTVPEFGPIICSPAIFAYGKSFEKFLRTKVINGYHAALKTENLANKLIYPPKLAQMALLENEINNVKK